MSSGGYWVGEYRWKMSVGSILDMSAQSGSGDYTSTSHRISSVVDL